MNFAPMAVNVLAFKINSMDRLSTFSFGPVQQLELFLNNKRNQGFGEDNGDLTTNVLPVNIVTDLDLADSIATKNSLI